MRQHYCKRDCRNKIVIMEITIKSTTANRRFGGGVVRYVPWALCAQLRGQEVHSTHSDTISFGSTCRVTDAKTSVSYLFEGQTCVWTSEGLLVADSIARVNWDFGFRRTRGQKQVENMFTQRATASVINTLLPYNAVVENGYMPCIERKSEDQVSRPLANSLKTTDLAAGKDNSRASRPTSLGRVTISSNGFSSRFPGSAHAGGSQDCSPESETSTEYAQLENETRNLLTVFLQSYNGLQHQRCSQPKALATMDRVSKSLVRKHEIAYKGDTFSYSLFLRYSNLLCPSSVPEVGLF